MSEYTSIDSTLEIPYGYCHCGCGGKTTICKKTSRRDGQIKGEPYRWLAGHCRITNPVANFWSKVSISNPLSCWIWNASKAAGYGRAYFQGKIRPAHRLAYELTFGPIPTDHFLCHSCDNPSCVNPYHMFVGTQTDNMTDASMKGRVPHGKKHWNTSLSEDQVREIRSKSASGLFSRSKLAAEYNVSKTTITNISAYRTWRHLS